MIDFSLDQLISDMSKYTGLSPQEVYDSIEPGRKDNSKTWDDFNFVNPTTDTSVTWYNRLNRTFIWECAIHPPWHLLNNLPPASRVLDYGAGLGTDCFWMREHGHAPTYFEINLAEIDFFKWRNTKYNLHIPIIEPYDDDLRFDYARCLYGIYDVVLFRDVLEHIPDYIRVLEAVLGVLESGGYLYIQAPFGTEDFGVHMRERWSVSDFLVTNGFKKMDGVVWKKIS